MLRPSLILLTGALLSGCVATDRSLSFSGEHLTQKDEPIPVQVIAGECDTPPKFLSGRAPIYPTPLHNQGIKTGRASVSFTVTKEGRVTDIRVIEASHPQFAAGMAHVMPSWRFEPAKRAGQPVEVTVQTSTTFTGAN